MTTYTKYDSITADVGPVGEGLLVQGTLLASATVASATAWQLLVPGGNTYLIDQNPAGTPTFNGITLANNSITAGLLSEVVGSGTVVNNGFLSRGLLFTTTNIAIGPNIPLAQLILPASSSHIINADLIVEDLTVPGLISSVSEITIITSDLSSLGVNLVSVKLVDGGNPNLTITTLSGSGLGPYTYQLVGTSPFGADQVKFTARVKLVVV